MENERSAMQFIFYGEKIPENVFVRHFVDKDRLSHGGGGDVARRNLRKDPHKDP